MRPVVQRVNPSHAVLMTMDMAVVVVRMVTRTILGVHKLVLSPKRTKTIDLAVMLHLDDELELFQIFLWYTAGFAVRNRLVHCQVQVWHQAAQC